jgi:hypothetical protein
VALLLVSPWVVFLVFNLTGQWPYGVFRTNAFVLAYVIPLVAVGLNELWQAIAKRSSRAGVVVAVVVVVALLIPTVPPLWSSYFWHKGRGTLTSEASVRRARRALRLLVGEEPSTRVAVAFDGQACTLLRYYVDHHEETRAELGPWTTAHIEEHCSKGRDVGYQKMLADVVTRETSFWLIIAKRANRKHTAKVLAKECTSHVSKAWRGTELFWCGKGGDQAPVMPP